MSWVGPYLTQFRSDARDTFTDTCRITRPGEGRGPWNSSEGSYDPPPPVTVYEGPCRIPPRGMSSSQVTSAGTSWTVGEFPLDLPVAGSEDVANGQTVTYLTSAHDPALVGRVFGVVEVARASQATARRLTVKEAQ